MNDWARKGILGVMLLLAACGGDGGSTSGGGTGGGTTGGGGVTGDQCSLRNRQVWAQSVLNEWYLFPETLPATLDPTPYTTVSDYIDALTATARGQRRDRFFTYLTSIAQESAFFSSGSSAGFGFRVSSEAVTRRVFISESFEGTVALAAGIDRGDEVLAIGTTPTTLRSVSDIIATEGTAGVTSALGPTTAGTTRTLRVTGPSGLRTLTLTKADYTLTPVSARYGVKVIEDGTRKPFVSGYSPPVLSAH